MKRTLISSGSPYERPIGFSRAVRVGNVINVAGTGPIGSDGKTFAPDDPYAQTKRCLEIIKTAIEEAGGRLEHVVRTRMLISDMSRWEEIARAHGEFFRDIRPASTLVEVKGFVQPDWFIELEAEAIIHDE